MNYYYIDIVNEIIKTPRNLLKNIEKLRDNTRVLFMYYGNGIGSALYINNLIEDNNVKFVYRCMDTSKFTISSCPSVMAYVSERKNNIMNYYILFICTKRSYQKLGYASALLNDFISEIKNRHKDQIKIILSSLESAVTYYEKIGFTWTRDCLSSYPVLCKYEKFEEGKEYFIMEYVP